MSWTRTIESKRLEAPKGTLFKQGNKQVVILRRGESLFAFDNRCPHEGYPLREGTIDGKCVLTCNWHNWKFKLEDGHNLYGEDSLRVYPTRIEDGFVWVDFSEKPAEQIHAECLDALKAAFQDRRYDRIARVLARMHFSGLDPLDAVRSALHWTHDRLERGATHAMGALPDWLDLVAEHEQDAELKLASLTEAIDHLSWDVLRQPTFPYAEPAAEWSPQVLIAALEEQDDPKVAAQLGAALDAGLLFADLQPLLTKAALAHYLSFGHALIYSMKAERTIRHLGPEVARPVLLALGRHLINASREDLIPEFRGYAPRLAWLEGKSLLERDSDEPLEIPFGLSTNRAMDWVVEALQSHRPQTVFTAMLGAAGKNLLHYDARFQNHTDLPVSSNFGWLGVTHAITFANALRTQAALDAQFWKPGLLQLACMIGRANPFVSVLVEGEQWQINNEEDFLKTALAKVMDHGLIDPIFSCHLLKTWMAVRDELPHLPSREKGWVLAGLNRFLNAPLKEKHVRRTARQALSLVGRDYASEVASDNG